jgi:hypothetical protein
LLFLIILYNDYTHCSATTAAAAAEAKPAKCKSGITKLLPGGKSDKAADTPPKRTDSCPSAAGVAVNAAAEKTSSKTDVSPKGMRSKLFGGLGLSKQKSNSGK